MEGTTATTTGAAAAAVWMTVSYEAKASGRAGGGSRGRAGNGNVAPSVRPSGAAAADVALGASGQSCERGGESALSLVSLL